MTVSVFGAANFGVSTEGTLIYTTGQQVSNMSLIWADRDGNESSALSIPVRGFLEAQPRLSPDGRRLAIAVNANTTDVWIVDLERGAWSRLTTEGANTRPVWMPDGNGVTFSSNRSGEPEVYWKALGATDVAEQLIARDGAQYPESWSPDGQRLLIQEEIGGTGRDIVVFAPGHGVAPLVASPFHERSSSFSPDGQLVAYTSDDTGQFEVYVQPFERPGERVTVSLLLDQVPVD